MFGVNKPFDIGWTYVEFLLLSGSLDSSVGSGTRSVPFLDSRLTVLTWIASSFSLLRLPAWYQRCMRVICFFSSPSRHALLDNGMKACLYLSGVLGSPLEIFRECVCTGHEAKSSFMEKSMIDVICTEAGAAFRFDRCFVGLQRGLM